MGVMMDSELNNKLLQAFRVVAWQVIKDVDEAVEGGDLDLLFERMVANAEDLETILTSPQQVAVNPLHTNKEKPNEDD
jgi:hypothetical protein